MTIQRSPASGPSHASSAPNDDAAEIALSGPNCTGSLSLRLGADGCIAAMLCVTAPDPEAYAALDHASFAVRPEIAETIGRAWLAAAAHARQSEAAR